MSFTSDVASCDFRGRRSRLQQICGDVARQSRALQRAQVSQEPILPLCLYMCVRVCVHGDLVYHGPPVCAVGQTFTGDHRDD